MDRVDADSGLLVELGHRVEQRRRQRARHRDAGQFVKQFHGDPLLPGQPMVRRQNHDDRLAEEFGDREIRLLNRTPKKGDVQAALPEPCQRVDRVFAVKNQANVWEALSQQRADQGQDLHVRGGKRADCDLAGAANRRFADEPDGVVHA